MLNLAKKEDLPEFKVKVLLPDRSDLHCYIAHRTQFMWENNVVEEVELFNKQWAEPPTSLSKALGYYEISAYIRGELKRDIAQQRMIEITRQYAKRQYTWFKHRLSPWSTQK